MAHRISVQERAQVATCYEVWHSVVQVRRWWRTVHGPCATLDPKTIKKCHDKLMNTGSVLDIRRSGRPSTSRSEENVRMVQDMFTRSPQKSTRQAAHESGLSRHIIRNVLKKELNFRPWKPHYSQQLSPEDCDHRMEYGMKTGRSCSRTSFGVTKLFFILEGLLTDTAVATGHRMIRGPQLKSLKAALRSQFGLALHLTKLWVRSFVKTP
jgi:hypothetical protein